MSGIDLAWLRMESATNPMMVVAVLTLLAPVSFASLRAVLEQRLLRFLRFTQSPVHDLMGTQWQTDLSELLVTKGYRLITHTRLNLVFERG